MIIPKAPILLFCFCLTSILLAKESIAQSWLNEAAREFEELRLKQLQTVRNSSNLIAFSTDGCSGFQSQNWSALAKALPGFEKQFGDKPPWENCCVSHDKAYWQGDVVDGYTKRKKADQVLRQCIADTGTRLTPQLSTKYKVSKEKLSQSFSVTAELMYRAVRLGGLPCSMLPWRWGYGWDNCAFSAVSDTPALYSDIKSDEHITFFNTTAWLDADRAHWNIPVHAWVFEPQQSTVRAGLFAQVLESKYDLLIDSDTSDNFQRRINLMIADNERGKKIVIRIAGKDITLPASKENGHAFNIIKLPVEVAQAFLDQGHLHYIAVTGVDEERHFEGDIQLVTDSGVSVISDIDDTVKISQVTNIPKLLDNTFIKDFVAVPGMADFYQYLNARGVAIHFVSSSPWQLYTPLQHFLEASNFPWSSLELKYVRFRDETLFNLLKKGTDTKPEQIEPVLRRFPHRQFILIGDSGEQDPEVYGDIARRYGSQIRYVLIRNVDGSDVDDERYQAAFENIGQGKWILFDHPGEIVKDLLLN